MTQLQSILVISLANAKESLTVYLLLANPAGNSLVQR